MQIHHGILKAILNWVKAEMLPGIILAWNSMIYAILILIILLIFIVYSLCGLLILFWKEVLYFIYGFYSLVGEQENIMQSQMFSVVYLGVLVTMLNVTIKNFCYID